MFQLTPWHREVLRSRMVQRAHALRDEIAAALHDAETRTALGLPTPLPEPGDEAVEDLESGIAVASVERDASELNAITEALSRLDSGRYGLCSDCGAPLAWERLMAQPQAVRCVRCENENERRRARPSLPAL
jgi:RNA polymerase-binding transcription factor DksA